MGSHIMSDEEKTYMVNFTIGSAIVLTTVIALMIINSCEPKRPIPTKDLRIQAEKSLQAFCYMPYVGSETPYVGSK